MELKNLGKFKIRYRIQQLKTNFEIPCLKT